jgi:hypothetical protein
LRQFASVNPDLAARLLHEELDDAFADPSDGQATEYSLAVRPPADLAADTAFRIRVSRGPLVLETDLPTGLAVAYLADEEAAVDEWKRWLADLRQRLSWEFGNR